jgi:hypothetical protein
MINTLPFDEIKAMPNLNLQLAKLPGRINQVIAEKNKLQEKYDKLITEYNELKSEMKTKNRSMDMILNTAFDFKGSDTLDSTGLDTDPEFVSKFLDKAKESITNMVDTNPENSEEIKEINRKRVNMILNPEFITNLASTFEQLGEGQMDSIIGMFSNNNNINSNVVDTPGPTVEEVDILNEMNMLMNNDSQH